MVFGPARREADAAIAHDRGCDAVLGRGRDFLTPGDLAVVVGVNVDEARRHQLAAGIDLFLAFAGDAPDFDDVTRADRYIRLEQLTAEPVRDVAATDDEVWIGDHGASSRVDLWPHHEFSRDAVNRRGRCSGLQYSSIRWFGTLLCVP